MLALGAGANTAVFSIVNAVLIRAVPYDQPDQLYRVFQEPQGRGPMPAAPANYLDWRSQSRSFASMAAFQRGVFKLDRGGEVEKIAGARVSANLFETLRTNAVMGRVFTPEEDKSGAPVAVISHSVWTRYLGADSESIGRNIRIDGRTFTVIGVMPAGFAYPDEQSALWTPLTLGDTERSLSRTENYLGVIGRLRAEVTDEQARAELSTIAQRLATAHPNSNERLGIALKSQREYAVGRVSTALLILFAAVALVLLIATANVSNLLLARTAARRREVAIRLSLGASRWRVIRQFLTESIVLGIAGGAAGWLLAQVSFDLLLRLIPEGVPSVSRIRLDGQVFLFTLGISVLVGVASGLAPALDGTRGKFTEGLQQGGRLTVGRRSARFRDLLVAGEVAVALVLLVGCGLAVRTMLKLYGVDPGFRPDRLLIVPVQLSAAEEEGGAAAGFRELTARVAALPGVAEVGATSAVPLTNEYTSTRFMVEGREIPASERVPVADYGVITPGYFRAMEIPLVRGRWFTDSDGPKSPPVAVINEAMADRFFPGEDPVGRRVRRGGRDSDQPWITIVGVVGDVRHLGLDMAPVPELFFPQAQAGWPQLYLMVRTATEPRGLVEPLRRVVRELGSDHDVGAPRTADELMAASVGTRRFAMQLLSLFAVLAFVLAGTGIYGVLSYSVAQRRQEIGIRMALGATAGAVVRFVVRRGAIPLIAGLGVGVAGALAATRAMTGLLWGVSPYDAPSFAGAVGVLALVGVTALIGPARRAARVDAGMVLRGD